MILRGQVIYFISQSSIDTTYQYDIDTDSMTSWGTNNKAYAAHILCGNTLYEIGGKDSWDLYSTLYSYPFGYAEVSKYAGITIAQADNLDLTVGEPMPTQLPYPTDTSLPFRLKLQMDATVTDTIN